MREKTRRDSSNTGRRNGRFTRYTTESIAWHGRALREATLVRRLVRIAGLGGSGVLGATGTIDALQKGAISELLLTPRFVEMNPGLALRTAQLGAASGARTTTIAGLAAFELDFAAGGIGAVLRRPCGRS